MPKAGLEPACLAAPPPQDGVSANSTTSAKSLFRRSRRLSRRGRGALLWLRWSSGSRLSGRGSRLRLIGLGSLPYNRTAARLRNQNSQRKRRDHEDDRGRRCRFAQNGAGAAGAEGGLRTAASESARPIRTLSLLKQHNKNQKNRYDD